MAIKPQESFNFYSHLAGVVAALIGTVVLARLASYSVPALITALIYGLSVTFLFLASAFYHAFKREENEISFWRKMDHFAIFCMIAGTYTPVCTLYLDGAWRWSMIGIQWGLVGFGLVLQFTFPRAPRILYTAIYIVMGWTALFPLRQILAAMTVTQIILMFAGGAAFTLGALFYAIRKPRLLPGIFSFHELFHIMVLIGGVLHYAMIYIVYLQQVA
jgi:hemolysin III